MAEAQVEEFSPGDENIDTRVIRVSYIQGGFSIKRGDSGEWFDGVINTPVQTGDVMYVADGARAELQFEGNVIRLDAKSGFDVFDLSEERSQFSLYSGAATIVLRNLSTRIIELDVANAAVTFSKLGKYKVRVFDDGATELVVLRGRCEVYNNGSTVSVFEGQRIVVEDGQYDIAEAGSMDEWDQWNAERDELLASGRGRGYIHQSEWIAGVDELDRYGQWTDTPEYGQVWTPLSVSVDWCPYRLGRWIWRDPFGWTWLSSEPWGWAPYHYGRWAFVRDRWRWVPGRSRYYAPALVGFLEYGDGAYFGWVPLAPRDRLFAWWGHRRPAGPGGVLYLNLNIGNAVTLTARITFGSGMVDHRRTLAGHHIDLRRGRPIRDFQLIPTRESLMPRPHGIRHTGWQEPRGFRRPVVRKNTNAPVVRPFAEKLPEIRELQGKPVSDVKRNSAGVRVTREVRGSSALDARRGGERPMGLVRAPGLSRSPLVKSRENKRPLTGSRSPQPSARLGQPPRSARELRELQERLVQSQRAQQPREQQALRDKKERQAQTQRVPQMRQDQERQAQRERQMREDQQRQARGQREQQMRQEQGQREPQVRQDQERQAQAQRERQMREDQQRQAQAQREQQMREDQQRQVQAQRERQMREDQLRQAQAQREQQMREDQQRQAQAQRERQMREDQQRQAQAQREQQMREDQQRQAQAQREQQMREEQQRQAQAQREQQMREDQQRQAQAQRERQMREDQQRQAQAQRERQMREDQQRQAQAQRERQMREDQQRQAQAQREQQMRQEQQRQAQAQREQQMRQEQQRQAQAQREQQMRQEQQRQAQAQREQQMRQEQQRQAQAQREQQMREEQQRQAQAQREQQMRQEQQRQQQVEQERRQREEQQRQQQAAQERRKKEEGKEK